MAFIILNHQLLPSEKAFISVDDRGFRFGDGVFETIRVHAGVPYQFDWHAERLRKGLGAIKIEANLHRLNEACRSLLKENKVSEGILRIQVTRGSGSLGYKPTNATPPTLLIETRALPAMDGAPVSLFLSSYQKISPQMLPVQYKLCQGLSSTLAIMEAEANGCDEALLLNAKGELCETGSGNIFWVKNAIIYTPMLACGVLEGAMRASVMRLSPASVCEVAATLADLQDADEVFITNAVWGVRRVKTLQPNAISWAEDKASAALAGLLSADMKSYCDDHRLRW